MRIRFAVSQNPIFIVPASLFQLEGILICVKAPHLPSMEVLQQFRVIDGPHVARPNYFCGINVGSVVHPIMIEIMVTNVSASMIVSIKTDATKL